MDYDADSCSELSFAQIKQAAKPWANIEVEVQKPHGNFTVHFLKVCHPPRGKSILLIHSVDLVRWVRVRKMVMMVLAGHLQRLLRRQPRSSRGLSPLMSLSLYF